MMNTKKVLMDASNGLYYCGTHDNKIIWEHYIDMATDIRNSNWDFYGWEVDILDEMILEVKEYVEYFYE